MACGWPVMTRQSKAMNIRADNVYQEYAKNKDPNVLFDKSAGWISGIQAAAGLNKQQKTTLAQQVQDQTTKAIFGSNFIERTGLGLDLTVQICRQVFDGIEAEAQVTQADSLNDLVALYRKLQPDLESKSAQYILRGRMEIVQHAKAFQHILTAFVCREEDMTEALLKETHRILTAGIPIIDPTGNGGSSEISPEDYGGIYRSVIVGAGTTNFTVPKFIPSQMQRLCANLKSELDQANKTNCIDPFSVAAKYSLEFVQIHPFQDGNGRMCRMLLNAIICRYAGIVVPIGEHGDADRQEYLGIKARSNDMCGHGEYALFVLQRGFTRLRDVKKKLAGKAATGTAGRGGGSGGK